MILQNRCNTDTVIRQATTYTCTSIASFSLSKLSVLSKSLLYTSVNKDHNWESRKLTFMHRQPFFNDFFSLTISINMCPRLVVAHMVAFIQSWSFIQVLLYFFVEPCVWTRIIRACSCLQFSTPRLTYSRRTMYTDTFQQIWFTFKTLTSLYRFI